MSAPDPAPAPTSGSAGGADHEATARGAAGRQASLHEVPDVSERIIVVFRDHGYRRIHMKARLKHLAAD